MIISRIKKLSASLALITAFASPATADEVIVFAAASMKNALDELATSWMAQTGHRVLISYAGSNQLAKQIIEGAPADIFVSAAVNWMDQVEKSGLVANNSRTDLFGNTLVLIAHGKDAKPVDIEQGFDLQGLLGQEKLAMALVDAVPAGQYGKAALENLGVWDSAVPLVAQADNVRAALGLVAAGEAPYGIVYATDAAADDNVTIVGTFPAESYPPIVYPGALLTGAADDADHAFFEVLSSEAAHASFAGQGFAILN